MFTTDNENPKGKKDECSIYDYYTCEGKCNE